MYMSFDRSGARIHACLPLLSPSFCIAYTKAYFHAPCYGLRRHTAAAFLGVLVYMKHVSACIIGIADMRAEITNVHSIHTFIRVCAISASQW